MKKTLLSLLMGASSFGAFAQWSQLPQEGGELRNIIQTPGGILAATEGGVFKSTDNGNTWTYSSNGLFAADSSIACQNFAQTATAFFVQTSNGIAKTTDNGSTWVSAGNIGFTGGMGNFSGLVAVGNKLYTCKYTNMSTYTIFSSIDNGATWIPGANVYSNNDSPRLFNIGGTVYVSKEDTLYTTATGASLVMFDRNGFPDTDRGIENLSGDGGYLYAGFRDGGNGAGFYRYDITNTVWQQMTNGIAPFIYAVGPHLVGNTLYSSVLTMSMTIQTYTSTNQGASWNQATLSGLSVDFVEKIYSLGASDILLFNPVDGITTSTNGGISWTPHNTGFKAHTFRDRRELVYAGGNLVTSWDLGIRMSNDGGNTWIPAMNGIPSTMFIDFGLYNAGGTLYSSFMDLSGKYMYKSGDGGANWTMVTYPAGNDDIEFWSHSNTAIFVKAAGSIYRSVNAGSSWVNITSNFNGAYNYNTSMVTDGTNLYIYGTSGSGNQIFMSADNGDNWTPVNNTGLPMTNAYIANNIFMNGNTLMAMWADYSGFPFSYKMSTYTGSGWNTVTVSGLPPGLVSSCSGNCGGGYRENDWFVKNGNIYYMSNKGLFMSTDNGDNFAPYNSGFYPGVNVTRLVADATMLYAGTEGNSIWKTSVPTSVAAHSKTTASLNIYPNPASNYVAVSYSKDMVDADSKLVVIDVLGSVVKEIALVEGSTKITMSTEDLKSGVYFYSISSSSKKSAAQKLVIEK